MTDCLPSPDEKREGRRCHHSVMTDERVHVLFYENLRGGGVTSAMTDERVLFGEKLRGEGVTDECYRQMKILDGRRCQVKLVLFRSPPSEVGVTSANY